LEKNVMFSDIFHAAALSGMGQIVPPISQETTRKVILASIGVLAAGATFYFVFRKRRSAKVGGV